MAAHKWLMIVLDGNAAMGPYWPTIVSEYLQKIVRHFCGNSRSGQVCKHLQSASIRFSNPQVKGVNTVCKVGLVMYNANSDLGCDVQFIHWTKEVDEFLNRLPYLAFNGDGLNPYAMAEGLVEALLMYPKPSTGIPTREYYNGERHCILVATSDPFAEKMTMALPKIREGGLVGTEVEICRADYRSVAQMFTPLDVSLSVISPKQLPVWREIFNLGNNILEIASTDPVTDSSGRFIVLLSEKLKEARVEPKETTTNVTLPSYSITSSNSEDLFFLEGQIGKETTVAQQINGAAITELKSVTSMESLRVVSQNQNAIDHSQVASSSTLPLTTVYDIDNIMAVLNAELNADNDIVLPRNQPRTCITLQEDNLNDLFQLNQLTSPFDDIGNSTEKRFSTEALLEIEAEFEQALLGTTPQNISKGQTSITASTANAFEQALLGNSSMSVLNPINISEDISEGYTSITASTDNSSNEVDSLQLAEPKTPSTKIWSPMLHKKRGNSSMSVLKPINNSWTSAASGLLPSSSSQPIGLQAKHVGAQSTSGSRKSSAILKGKGFNARHSGIIPTRGVFSLVNVPHALSTSDIMKTDAMVQQGTSTARDTQIPSAVVFGFSTVPHAMSTSDIMRTTTISQGFNARDTQFSSGVAFGSTSTVPHATSRSDIMRTATIPQGFNAWDTQIPSGVAFGSTSTVPHAVSTTDIMRTATISQDFNAWNTQIPSEIAFGSTSTVPHITSTTDITRTAAISQGFNARDTQISAGAAFGSMAPHAMTDSYIQPSSLSHHQISPNITSQSTSISGPLMEQNLSGYKRDLMSAFGSPTPAVRASTFIPLSGMPRRTHTRLLPPLVPMEYQRDYVKTWEGAISGILQNSTISYNEARAYRKVTARQTLTVEWPRWLQINRILRQSVVNNSMSITRGTVDYVVIEVLTSNNYDLHNCLRDRDFCAKFVLPSQTLIITPTNDPHRFIGTIFRGRQDFTALQFTHSSRSRAAKAARLT